MGTTLNVIGPASGDEAGPTSRRCSMPGTAASAGSRPTANCLASTPAPGRPVEVSADFIDVTRAAISAAAATDGLFDPTLGARLVSLGYDRTFVELPADATQRFAAPWIVGAWRRIEVDPIARTVRIPARIEPGLRWYRQGHGGRRRPRCARRTRDRPRGRRCRRRPRRSRHATGPGRLAGRPRGCRRTDDGPDRDGCPGHVIHDAPSLAGGRRTTTPPPRPAHR